MVLCLRYMFAPTIRAAANIKTAIKPKRMDLFLKKLFPPRLDPAAFNAERSKTLGPVGLLAEAGDVNVEVGEVGLLLGVDRG